MKKILSVLLFLVICVRLFSQDAQDYFSRGIDAEEYDLKQSIKLYTIALEMDPELYDVYMRRGYAYMETYQYSKAAEDFSKYIDFNSMLSRVYFRRSICYRVSGELNKSLKDINRAIELDENVEADYLSRGTIYSLLQKNEEGLKDFLNVIDMSPDRYEGYMNAAEVYFVLEEYENCFEYFEKCLKKFPGNGYVYFSYLIHGFKYDMKKYEDVKKKLLTNLEMIKKSGSQWEHSVSLFLSGKIDSKSLLKRAEKKKERLCEAYTYIAYSHLFSGDKKKAKKYFSKSVKIGVGNYYEYMAALKELKEL